MTLLLTLFLKSLLLFAVSGLLLFALRRSSAAARSLVCLLMLGAVLVLPLCSTVLPGWQVPVPEPTPARSSPALPVREGEEASQALTQTPRSVPPAASPSASFLTGRTPAKSLVTKQGGGLLTQGGGFFVFYLFGILLASARPLLGLWGIRRLSRECTTVTDLQTRTLAADCTHLLGLKTPPRLCAATVSVPMTWGWRRPVIVLPPLSADWPKDRLRSVLLHEMAHIKRRDWPAHRLADVACALYWFHPLVWLTARRLRVESELACDDLVLSSGIPAPVYARHLPEIASAVLCVPGRSHTAIAMAQTSQIESRLTMILDKTRRRILPRRAFIFGVALAAAALVPLAILKPTAKAQAAPVVAGAVQLLGIVDAVTPNGSEWSGEGKVLPVPVFSNYRGADTKVTARPGQKALFFVFQLPQSVQPIQVIYGISSTARDGFSMTRVGSSPGHRTASATTTMQSLQMQVSGNKTVYGAAFPVSLTRTDIRVGIPSGLWVKEAVFSYRSDQYLNSVVVSDTYRHLNVDISHHNKITLNLPTKNTHIFDNFRAIAVGTHGQETILPGVEARGFSSQEEMTISIPHIHSPFRSLRIESRTFAWQEFKNVALQPVK